jgi:hypothetical protein
MIHDGSLKRMLAYECVVSLQYGLTDTCLQHFLAPRHCSIARTSINAVSAFKTSRIEAAFAPGLTTRGLKGHLASESGAGHNGDAHGQAVEEKDTHQLNCTDDCAHLCMSRHTSDPGYFQRAQSVFVSTTMISSSFQR